MTVSNVIGPSEKAIVSKYPVKGLYYMTVGVPQVILKWELMLGLLLMFS